MPELTLKEWRAEGRRLKAEGLSIENIHERIGKYNNGYRLERSNSKGINFRPLNIRADRVKAEKVPDESRGLFIDDESFDKYKKSVAQDKRGIDARTKQATTDKGIKYNKGHGQSAKTGGPTSSRNLMLENGARNSAHGQANPSRAGLVNSGVATSWREDAINYQDSSGLPLEQTPWDNQQIRNAAPDQVDAVTAKVQEARWKAIKKNPNARPIRTNPNPQVKNPPTKQNFAGLTIDKTRPGSPKPRAPKGMNGVLPWFDYIGPLDQMTGGHVESTIDKGVNVLRQSLGIEPNPVGHHPTPDPLGAVTNTVARGIWDMGNKLFGNNNPYPQDIQ